MFRCHCFCFCFCCALPVALRISWIALIVVSPLNATHELYVSPEHFASNGFTKLPSGWNPAFRRHFTSPYSGCFLKRGRLYVSPVHIASSNLGVIHSDFPIFMKRHCEKRATFWLIFTIPLHFQLLVVSARVCNEVRGGLIASIMKRYWRHDVEDLGFARLCWWWLWWCGSSDFWRRIYRYTVKDV